MSHATLLRSRTVVPVSSPPIDDGAVRIEAGRIAAVGPWAELKRGADAVTLDLGHSLLMPGLINAHCHLDYTGMAGQLPSPRVFPDWIKQIITLKAGWSRADFVRSWCSGAEMLVRSGTTTVMDIEAFPEILPDVWPATPLRVVSCGELISVRRGEPVSELVSERVAWLIAAGEGDPAKQVGLSPHAPYSTQPDLLTLAAGAARDRSWLATIHLAESEAEFEMFMYRRGPMFEWLKNQRAMDDCGVGSPVRHVDSCGLLGPNCVAVHVNYLWDHDAETLGRTGTSVAHCPRSHEFFQHRRFPFDRLVAAGVNICLGTDSLASTWARRGEPLALNLFSEMRTFAAMAPMVPPETIVRLATAGGARALGRSGELGELRQGALADLIVLPDSTDSSDPWQTVLNHRGDVAGSMIGGRWVLPPPSLTP